MKAFRCRVCDAALYFENYLCTTCGTSQGFSRDERSIVPLTAEGGYVDATGARWTVCANAGIAGCTWLAAEGNQLCFSCSLTRTRPHHDDAVGMTQYVVAERAKRHVIVELDTLGFPINPRSEDNPTGLAFDLLSSMPSH